MINIKAIILAAGIGSRLRPLTLEKPKCMVKIDGLPLIEHQIKAYMRSGLEKDSIYVVVGYKSQIIRDFLKEKYEGINIVENKDFLSTNNMYSLYLALNKLKMDDSESLFINNGDCIYNPDIILGLAISKNSNLIACDEGSYIPESMKIRINEGRIVDISKEISKSSAFGASIDLYKMSFKATQKLKKIIEEYIYTKKERNLWTEVSIKDLFNYEIFKSYNIKGKSWVEIDNLDDLAIADIKFSRLNLKNKKCFIMDLDGTVYLGNKPINGTINFINSYMEKKDFYFLTNNTSKLPYDYVKTLKKMGINALENKIITPIYPLLDYLKENK
ncbi:MAG: NTP transferase domain-containing protein, partial [Methanobacterium paludis]|nr:NTP transferase domain-containing protein [Methanobacterium paludis]